MMSEPIGQSFLVAGFFIANSDDLRNKNFKSSSVYSVPKTMLVTLNFICLSDVTAQKDSLSMNSVGHWRMSLTPVCDV